MASWETHQEGWGTLQGLGAATEAGRIPQDAPALVVPSACEALAALSCRRGGAVGLHGCAVTLRAEAGCKAEGVNRDGLAASCGSPGSVPFRPLSVPIGATLLSLIPTRAHSAAYQRRSAGQGAAAVSVLGGALMGRMAADSGGPAASIPGPGPGGTDADTAFVCARRDGGSDKVPPAALGWRVQR